MEAPWVAAMMQGGAGRGLVRGLEGRGLAAGGVRVVRTTGCRPVSAAQAGSASPAQGAGRVPGKVTATGWAPSASAR